MSVGTNRIRSHWSTARLGEVATLVSGGTPSKGRPDWWAGTIPWASPKDLKVPRLWDTEDHVTEEAAREGSRIVPAGTLFIVIRGMILAKDIPVALAMRPMAFNQDLKAILPGERINPEFLLFALQADKDRRHRLLGSSAHGTKSIVTSAIADIVVPLPPLAEQRAIARALRAVQVAKDARRRELDLERERRAALTVNLFTHGIHGDAEVVVTEYGRVPASWATVELDECSVVQTGVAKGRDLNGSPVTEVPYLRVANVQDGYLDLAEVKTITVRESEVQRYALQDGDVVVTEGGDFDKLGRGFIWHGQISPCLHQNHVFAVRPDRRRVSPEFLTYLFGSPYGKAYFLSVAHKTTNLACINTAKLKRFPVILPNLDEQQQITEALRACDACIAATAEEIVLLDELFPALLEELMSGRLSSVPLIEPGEGETPT